MRKQPSTKSQLAVREAFLNNQNWRRFNSWRLGTRTSLLLPPVSFNSALVSSLSLVLLLLLTLSPALLSSGEWRPFSREVLGAGTGGCWANRLPLVGVLLADGGNGAGRIGLPAFESDVDDGDGDKPFLQKGISIERKRKNEVWYTKGSQMKW